MFKFFRVLIMFRRTIWVSACYTLFQIIQISISCPYFCWFTLSCSVLVVPHRRFISTDTLAECRACADTHALYPLWYAGAASALIRMCCACADMQGHPSQYVGAASVLIRKSCVHADTHVLYPGGCVRADVRGLRRRRYAGAASALPHRRLAQFQLLTEKGVGV